MSDRDHDNAEGILMRLHDDLEAIARELVEAVNDFEPSLARSKILHCAGQLEGVCMALGWQGYVPDA